MVLVVALLWLADRIWPLPLPQDDLARVVLAEDGTPLWRFADANGVWRYPVQTREVSPYYLDALLTYEDRWFYQHPTTQSPAQKLWERACSRKRWVSWQRCHRHAAFASKPAPTLGRVHPQVIKLKLKRANLYACRELACVIDNQRHSYAHLLIRTRTCR